MYKEVIPGSYLCKIGQGVAYYLVSKGVYDNIKPRFNSELNYAQIATDHLLTGNRYQTEFHKVILVNWEDLPLSYQMDAIAINKEIRRRYWKEFYTAQNSFMSKNLKDALFSVVDQSTGELRHLKLNREVDTANGPVYNLAGTALPQAMSEESQRAHKGLWEQLSKTTVPQLDAEYYKFDFPRPTDNKVSNNTNNSSMNLFGNIPGLNLSFGPLEKGRIALSLNGDLAFRDKMGQYVTIQEEGTQKTRVEVGDLKFDIDFYKVPTQELEVGDVILLDSELLLVNEKKNGDVQFVNPLTGAKTTKLQRSNILGLYFYTKVVSLFDMAGGTGGLGLNGLDPMTLMLLSGQGGSFGSGDLSQLLVLSQLTKGGNEINPMLLMAMSKGGGGNNDFMQSFMLMQALGGGKGLGSLLGGKKKAAQPPAPVRKTTTPKKAAPKKAAKKAAARREAAGS